MRLKRGTEVETLAREVQLGEALERGGRARGHGRRHMLWRATLVLTVVGSLYCWAYFSIGADPMAWAVLIGVSGGLVNLGLLRLTGRTLLCSHIGVAILFAVLGATAYLAGGVLSSVYPWLYIVPLVAAFLIGLGTAWLWVAVVWLTTLVFWSLDLVPEVAMIPSAGIELHAVQNHLAMSLALALLATVFLRSLRSARRGLEASNTWLAEEVERRGRVESELRASEARLRDLVESSPALLGTHDGSGRILSANGALRRVLGVESNCDVLGLCLEDLLEPSTSGKVAEYLHEIAARGSACGLARVRTRSGDSRLLEYESLVRSASGTKSEVQIQARDVTEEEKARRSLERQVEQEELVSAVATRFIAVDGADLEPAIESALAELAGFADVDRGILRLADERTGRLSESIEWCREGIPKRHFAAGGALEDFPSIGNRLRLLETVIVNDVREMDRRERRELRVLLGADVRSAVVVPLVGREGLLGFLGLVSLVGSRTWRHENLVLAYISGYVFASAILRARNERRALRLEAEVQQARKMESLGVVAAGIAHDFNNHLMAILGNTGLAQSELREGSEAWQAAERVMESAHHAARLTGQMLSFSGSANLVLERIPLNDVLTCVASGDELDSRPECAVDLDLAPQPPLVEIDRGQMRQVVRSLITNAAEAMAGRNGSVLVRSGLTKVAAEAAPTVFRPLATVPSSGTYAFFEVVDCGAGIDREHLPRVFEPFFSTRFQGRGLGLAAALGIVRAHQGIIEVETVFGRGTTVRVFLPIADHRHEEASESQPREQASGRGSILVIDDESSMIEILTRLLERSGFAVLPARDEAGALELLRRNGSDLKAALLDFSVAEGNSGPLADHLGTARGGVPVILMSGYPRSELEGRMRGTGVAGYLEKPFDGEVLISEIERVLGE